MTDPDDPLRGLDPYPRERIEGLHQERAELLEEIVSTPGPGKQPSSAPSKVLLAVGVAAALVIVGGGGWLLGNAGSDDSAGDRVAAASATSASTAPAQSASPPAPTNPSTATPATPMTPTPRHAGGVRLVRHGHTCTRLTGVTLGKVLRLQSRRAQLPATGRGRYYLVLRNHHCVVQVAHPHDR